MRTLLILSTSESTSLKLLYSLSSEIFVIVILQFWFPHRQRLIDFRKGVTGLGGGFISFHNNTVSCFHLRGNFSTRGQICSAPRCSLRCRSTVQKSSFLWSGLELLFLLSCAVPGPIAWVWRLGPRSTFPIRTHVPAVHSNKLYLIVASSPTLLVCVKHATYIG